MTAFFNKKLIVFSVAALTIFCTSCNKTAQQEPENTGGAIVSINDGTSGNNDNNTAANQNTENQKTEVKIGLVKNSASALGAAPLFVNTEDGTAYEKYVPAVYNTYDELMNALINGDVDMGTLPPDKALLTYNKTKCQVAAVTSGSNYYVAENGTSIKGIPDLNGKEITISSEDTMAETVLNIIASHNGISVTYKKAENNQQIIDGLKNGSIKLALIQEPYLSYVTSENVNSAIDLYDYWNEAVDSELVTSCLVVRKDFLDSHYNAFLNMLKDYKAAAQIAKRDSQATAEAASKFALTDNSEACKAAVPGCDVAFKTGEPMKKMLDGFYNAAANSGSEILQGNMPDANFYNMNE